jgi:hypothetical protein
MASNLIRLKFFACVAMASPGVDRPNLDGAARFSELTAGLNSPGVDPDSVHLCLDKDLGVDPDAGG